MVLNLGVLDTYGGPLGLCLIFQMGPEPLCESPPTKLNTFNMGQVEVKIKREVEFEYLYSYLLLLNKYL